MKPMMKVIQSAYIEQNDCENALQEFLFSYRVTPHSLTQIPLADLMYSRRIRYSLPDISNEINSKSMQSGMIVLQSKSGSTIQQENVDQRKIR